MSKEYLGDGVYVDVDELGLILTTENGIDVTNRIVLEEEVYGALLRYVDRRSWENKAWPLIHGRTCRKVHHEHGGYLHASDDDGPYDVDGVMYCGRCHQFVS